jgi:hypothetical protein
MLALATPVHCTTVSVMQSSAVDTFASLPTPVADFARRAIGTVAAPFRVRLVQRGEMCPKPGGSWKPFTAEQTIEIAKVEFSWRARMRILPGVWVGVVDEYVGGVGRLDAKLWGRIGIAHAEGVETAKGEAMRYLAELPWAPHAMAGNRALEWTMLAADRVEVATWVAGDRVTVQLVFDRAGDILRAEAPARGYHDGKSTVMRPWSGVFSEYRRFDGIRVPTRAEVSWQLPAGRYTYFSGEIVELEAVA